MKYALLFEVGNSLMAVDVKRIKQVLRKREITPLPQSPDYLDGVVIYRDKVIPVVNIAKKINKNEGIGKNRIILASLDSLVIGFRVDNVVEVVDTSNCKLEGHDDKGLIEGTIKYKDNQIVVIIDPDQLFTKEERKTLERIQ